MTAVTRSNYYGKIIRLSLLVTAAAGAVAFVGSLGVHDDAAQVHPAPAAHSVVVEGAGTDGVTNGDWPWGPRPTILAQADQKPLLTTTDNGDWPWLQRH